MDQNQDEIIVGKSNNSEHANVDTKEEDLPSSPEEETEEVAEVLEEKHISIEEIDDNFSAFHSDPACSALRFNVFDDDDEIPISPVNLGASGKVDGKVFDAEAAGDFKGNAINAPKISASIQRDVKFSFTDVDSLAEEIAEIYGYYEMSSFPLNHNAFHVFLVKKGYLAWDNLTEFQKLDLIQTILEDCESATDKKRFDAIMALNYLAQGCWDDFRKLEEQIKCIKENVSMMLRCNAFWSVWMVFKLISSTLIDLWNRGKKEQALEGCCSVLATIMHVTLDDIEANVELYEEFINDLKVENIFAELISFVVGIVEFNPSCFLLKKVFIILRCYLLLTLGDSKILREKKELRRAKAGLRSSKDDTLLRCETIGVLQDNKWWKDGAQRKLMTLSELQEIVSAEEEAKSSVKKELPWSPKSSLEAFSDIFALNPDLTERTHSFQGCFMMPKVIKQRMDLMVQNLHVPLGVFQKEEEKLISKYPTLYENQEQTFSEETDRIFVTVLSMFEDMLESFRSVLDECVPRKSLRDSNEFFSPMDADPTYFDEDRLRQPEIVVKAVSSIIISLLKHFKLNHIYQFECLTAEMFTAGYVPTILRFFNRDLTPHVFQRPTYKDPGCLFHIMKVEYFQFFQEDDTFNEEGGSSTTDSELLKRNVYAYTNLFRILNKLVKGYSCRIRAMSMLNCMGSLQKALNVRDPFFQQYVLKLCKALCRFMTQEWKKSNLQIITAIFHKVRHRIMDGDGGWIGEMSLACKGRKTKLDQNAMWPWDFSEEEICLARNVLAYVTRRFGNIIGRKRVNSYHQQQKLSTSNTPGPSEKQSEEWLSWEL